MVQMKFQNIGGCFSGECRQSVPFPKFRSESDHSLDTRQAGGLMETKPKKNIAVIFGTRPEVIKLYPVFRSLRGRENVHCIAIATGQQRQMQLQTLTALKFAVDTDLDIMSDNQSLTGLTTRLLTELSSTLQRLKPDMVLVQGDTTTAFCGALAAFYQKIPVGHVEAGLRTGNKCQPFPEETNRMLITALSDLHFAPTQGAEEALRSENVPENRIVVTGNTVIDTLFMTLARLDSGELRPSGDLQIVLQKVGKKRIILVTGHRRESFGEGFRNICQALKKISAAATDAAVVYPVHLNPNIRQTVHELIGDTPGVLLIPPLDYVSFVSLLRDTFIVLTDSGGIQEETTALGKPTLIMRETTERREAIHCGVARLVGTSTETIVNSTLDLLSGSETYGQMAIPASVFGNGKASERIAEVCCSFLGGNLLFRESGPGAYNL